MANGPATTFKAAITGQQCSNTLGTGHRHWGSRRDLGKRFQFFHLFKPCARNPKSGAEVAQKDSSSVRSGRNNSAEVPNRQAVTSGAGSRVRTDDLLITNQLVHGRANAGFVEPA